MSDEIATSTDQDYLDQLAEQPPSASEKGPYAPDQTPGVPPTPAMQPGQQTTDEVQPQEGGPVIDEEATAEEEGSEEVASSEWDDYTVDELKTYANEYGLTVTRADGESGEPLKADYVAALETWQKEQE